MGTTDCHPTTALALLAAVTFKAVRFAANPQILGAIRVLICSQRAARGGKRSLSIAGFAFSDNSLKAAPISSTDQIGRKPRAGIRLDNSGNCLLRSRGALALAGQTTALKLLDVGTPPGPTSKKFCVRDVGSDPPRHFFRELPTGFFLATEIAALNSP
jgi:hypothetical protein